ncbi:MAG: adenosine deaminase [Anaerolineae bacterium]|nr:adenosine deaminase [Anaerolineae bacterium]MDQ7036553.1 adenosine deaminase [Anaerolineae bacterium]
MSLSDFIYKMPKVELHVHIEGAIQPQTLLYLAKKNQIDLPAKDVVGLREWYRFVDFPHFVQIYLKASTCIQTIADIEFVARDFLANQAAQNIVYSEATWTPHTHFQQKGLSYDDQLAALNRARDWAKRELNVDMGLVIDISRAGTTPDEALIIAQWAVKNHDNGVVAFGIGGQEVAYPPSLFTAAFDFARANHLPILPHAGETVGADSIWSALKDAHATRLYHGVRALEDDKLVAYLREKQIPLDICPTSNVCLGVVPDIQSHMLPKLLDAGLYVTINSDDPPMFNTTLTKEYQLLADTFQYDATMIEKLVMNGVHASFLSDAKKQRMADDFTRQFSTLQKS